jgi:hypothetical protein
MEFWTEVKKRFGVVTKIVTCNTIVVTRYAPTLLLFSELPQRKMLTGNISKRQIYPLWAKARGQVFGN